MAKGNRPPLPEPTVHAAQPTMADARERAGLDQPVSLENAKHIGPPMIQNPMTPELTKAMEAPQPPVVASPLDVPAGGDGARRYMMAAHALCSSSNVQQAAKKKAMAYLRAAIALLEE